MEVDLEDLKGHLAIKIFNPAATGEHDKYHWIPNEDSPPNSHCEVMEIEGDSVTIAIVTDAGGEDEDMSMETHNRHMIVDFLEMNHG